MPLMKNVYLHWLYIDEDKVIVLSGFVVPSFKPDCFYTVMFPSTARAFF